MLLQQIINGITIGGIYALVAVGFTMVFGVLELTNFAHSSVFMLGAYIAATLFGKELGLSTTIIMTIGACGVLGIIIDRFALMPMRKREASKVSYLICTIGMSTFLQNLVQLVFGSAAISFPQVVGSGNLKIGNATVSYIQIFIIILTLILMAILTLLINKSRIGASMRGVAQNPRAAQLMGINVDSVISFTFFLGSALAAIAGIMVGMYYRTIDLNLGYIVSMKTFAAAVLGGIGVMPGAVLGGILIGVLETLFSGYVHAGFKDSVSFIILIIVLMIKPEGLLGKRV